MSLAAGTRLAHYKIVEPIGKGGMGEVYRARDSKLGRDVAIKVLADELRDDLPVDVRQAISSKRSMCEGAAGHE